MVLLIPDQQFSLYLKLKHATLHEVLLLLLQDFKTTFTIIILKHTFMSFKKLRETSKYYLMVKRAKSQYIFWVSLI